MLGSETILNIGFKERQIANPRLQKVLLMLLGELRQRLGRNDVEVTLSTITNGCFKPTFFNPMDNLTFANAKNGSQTLDGEEIASDVAQTQVVPP